MAKTPGDYLRSLGKTYVPSDDEVPCPECNGAAEGCENCDGAGFVPGDPEEINGPYDGEEE